MLPVYMGKAADYQRGEILDQMDIEAIVSMKLTDEQVMGVALMLSDRTREEIEDHYTRAELRELISGAVAKMLYNSNDPRTLIPVAGQEPLSAEDFDISIEEVRGMTGINYADIAAINGGSLYAVCKSCKVGSKSETVTYYFRKKKDALDAVMKALNYTSYEDNDLVSMTYARYDDQGHAQEFLVLYEKDRGCEE